MPSPLCVYWVADKSTAVQQLQLLVLQDTIQYILCVWPGSRDAPRQINAMPFPLSAANGGTQNKHGLEEKRERR